MHEVSRVYVTLTFDDGRKRRRSISTENLSYFMCDELAELFDLDHPADLSSVEMPRFK
jgi:hypothetical protein